jgi:hypothetical protein
MKTFIHTDVILEGLYICPDYWLCQSELSPICGHGAPHKAMPDVLCTTAPLNFPAPYPICSILYDLRTKLRLSEEDCRIKLCRPATSYDKRRIEEYDKDHKV